MLEGYVRPWLLSLLQRYLEVKEEDLKLSLWGGDLHLNSGQRFRRLRRASARTSTAVWMWADFASIARPLRGATTQAGRAASEASQQRPGPEEGLDGAAGGKSHL